MDCPKCGYAMTPFDVECPKCKRLAEAGVKSPDQPSGSGGRSIRAQGPPPGASCWQRFKAEFRAASDAAAESVQARARAGEPAADETAALVPKPQPRSAWAVARSLASLALVLLLVEVFIGHRGPRHTAPQQRAQYEAEAQRGMDQMRAQDAQRRAQDAARAQAQQAAPAPVGPQDYGVITVRVGDTREVALWPSQRLPLGGTAVAMWISITNGSRDRLWVFEDNFHADICGSLRSPLHYPDSTPVDEGVARNMFLYPIPDLPGIWGREIAVGETASGYLYFAPAGQGCGKAVLEADLRTNGARAEIMRE